MRPPWTTTALQVRRNHGFNTDASSIGRVSYMVKILMGLPHKFESHTFFGTANWPQAPLTPRPRENLRV